MTIAITGASGFIGRRLILLDAHARMIVDIVERVFP